MPVKELHPESCPFDNSYVNCLKFSRSKMEPAVGIEPTTRSLQNCCSTTELSWLKHALGVFGSGYVRRGRGDCLCRFWPISVNYTLCGSVDPARHGRTGARGK